MSKVHRYDVKVEWVGNRGFGTRDYRSYGRDHVISAGSEKPVIPGSSDPSFGGDPARWNPEEMLVAATAACHKLWYLHLCSDRGVTVTSYIDEAVGFMEEDDKGSGQFSRIVLRPLVTVSDQSMAAAALDAHEEAHRMCFVANSLRCPIECEPQVSAPTRAAA